MGMNVGKLIAQGRQAKEMSQKDLATKICEKPQVVTEYESGKAIPNQQILAKMERALGSKGLRCLRWQEEVGRFWAKSSRHVLSLQTIIPGVDMMRDYFCSPSVIKSLYAIIQCFNRNF